MLLSFLFCFSLIKIIYIFNVYIKIKKIFFFLNFYLKSKLNRKLHEELHIISTQTKIEKREIECQLLIGAIIEFIIEGEKYDISIF